MILVAVACGPVSRVEPAVGDRPVMVDKITGSWKEAGVLGEVRALAASFARAWRDGDHKAAWALLSPAWRKTFTAAAGTPDPLELFAKGRLPRAEGVIPWDPVVALFGERLMYLSLPTREMGVLETPGRLLVYAVQDDGTWASFRVVTVGAARYLEPIGVLE
ncbi:MAG: hypothetical protein ABIK09_12665 [Pseudomonadota bacterium]